MKKKLTPKDMAAVAKTLELVAENPPAHESWDRPGTATLASRLTGWLKEQL